MTATIIQFPIKKPDRNWKDWAWVSECKDLFDKSYAAEKTFRGKLNADAKQMEQWGTLQTERHRRAQREYNLRMAKMAENAALGIKVWE